MRPFASRVIPHYHCKLMVKETDQISTDFCTTALEALATFATRSNELVEQTGQINWSNKRRFLHDGARGTRDLRDPEDRPDALLAYLLLSSLKFSDTKVCEL